MQIALFLLILLLATMKMPMFDGQMIGEVVGEPFDRYHNTLTTLAHIY